MQTYPIAKHLVLVGGGHSHVIVLRMLGMRRVPGLAITLISPDVETAYSGMLPGVVAGYYSEDDIHIDLARLARFAGARLIRARVTGIDPVAQRVRCEGRPELPYDALSIDTGITPALDDIAGANAGIAVKPINDFLEKFEAFRARVAAGKVASAGFVGAGAGGVELCLAVAGRLSKADAAVAIHLFSDKSTILPGYPQSVGERFARHLAGRGVTVHSHFTATRYRDGMLSSAQGENCHLDEVFFVTRAAAPAWLGETGLSLDENGFIKVRGTLQAMTFDNVFAAGDIASVVDFPRPRAGVFAVRQGRPLYRNLLAVLHGRSAKPFRPQREFLSLITTGSRYAVASRNGFSVEGQWVWRWKDWIDRRFMHRFNRLPAMKTEPMTGLLAEFDEQMRCGGCGSKVSADILDEVLRELGAGGDQRDDAAVIEVPPGKVMLSSVDAFRAFIDDPFVFAQVAVNHALGDIYAMGGEPVSALAIVTLPYATPAKTKDMLRELLQGALKTLQAEQVALVGGHTSEGMELSLGFTVNGTARPDGLLTKQGLQDGDLLILTKALGTGVLFAADMQARARGEWIDAAIDTMLKSNRAAARLLPGHGVHAATDVTGFGLAGHLSEMLAASGCRATLDLDKVPILAGALEALSAGVTSTLHEGNRRSVPGVAYADHPTFEIMFDPQTAGGLLVGVAADRAESLAAELRATGYGDANIIGRVHSAGTPGIAFAPY